MSPTTIKEKVVVVGKAILSGTSTVFDIVYELSGRRAGTLHKGAAFLYDLAQDGGDRSGGDGNGAPHKASEVVKKAAEPVKRAAEAVKKAAEPVKKAVEPAQAAPSPALPIKGYDELNVKAVESALEALSADELAQVRQYETANKNRKTVLRAIEKVAGA
jgi:hypothetical protein